MAYGIESSVVCVLVLYSICWVFSLLRFYVRIGIVGRFYTEDWFALVAILVSLPAASCYLVGIYHFDLDRDNSAFSSVQTLEKAFKMVFFSALFNTSSMGLIKISFGFTLLHFLNNRTQILVTRAITVSVAIFTTILGFFWIFYCTPVSYAWTRAIDPYFLLESLGDNPVALGMKPHGSCKSSSHITNLYYAQASLSLFVDLALGIVLPALLLKDLQMKWSLKLSTFALLSFSAIASIATVMRFQYIHELIKINNALKAANPIMVWSSFEFSLCIIGAACTTLKPLVTKIRLFTESTLDSSHSKTPKSLPNPRIRLDCRDDMDLEMSGSTTYTDAKADSKDFFNISRSDIRT